MTRVALIGRSGRMGQAIAALVTARDDVRLDAEAPEVLIDFSAPAALAGTLARARDARVPLVIGTTGLDEAHQAAIDEAAGEIAVLQAANTSLGITLLAHLVREAAARLGPDWDVEIVEMHHRHKVDAPSGTALLLGGAAAAGRGADLADLAAFDRRGVRAPGAVGFASLRGGSVAGDHQVIFAGAAERLELGHRAESRAVFAEGALRAALWLIGRPPGRYVMRDVLGL